MSTFKFKNLKFETSKINKPQTQKRKKHTKKKPNKYISAHPVD